MSNENGVVPPILTPVKVSYHARSSQVNTHGLRLPTLRWQTEGQLWKRFSYIPMSFRFLTREVGPPHTLSFTLCARKHRGGHNLVLMEEVA